MLNRRGLLLGLLAAPAIIRTPGLLMAVKPVPNIVLSPSYLGLRPEDKFVNYVPGQLLTWNGIAWNPYSAH